MTEKITHFFKNIGCHIKSIISKIDWKNKKTIAVAAGAAVVVISAVLIGIFAGGGNSNAPGGDGGTLIGQDPCDCCPDCNQDECECDECANSSDCKCSAKRMASVCTITAKSTDKHIENEYAKFDFMLTFSATNEGDGLYGDYTGSGELRMVHDEADYLAAMGGLMTAAKLEIIGQLNNIHFTLAKPSDGDDPNIIARGNGEMQWDNTVVESIFVDQYGNSMPWPWNGNSSEHFTIEIEIFDNGAGVLHISYYFASLSYEVCLSQP